MPKKNPEIDAFIKECQSWQKELTQLRKILLACDLTEELKWRQPCFMSPEGNIAIIGSFKNACVLSFFKGVLLKDPQKILTKPGENSQSARVIRFTSVAEIVRLQSVLEAYIYEAVENEKAGLKVEFTESKNFEIPEELQNKFAEMPAFEAAFDALTTGRQRAYVMFFSAAKQAKTRESRIESYVQRIMDGKGMNDCVCGLSKRMPGCDGSHKILEK